MTKADLHEQLVKEVDQYCPNCTPKSKKLVVELMEDVLAAPEEQRQKIVDFLRLSKKAEDYGLDVNVDKSTKLFLSRTLRRIPSLPRLR